MPNELIRKNRLELLDHQRMADTIVQLVLKWKNHPWMINQGQCEDFANKVTKIIIGSASMWDNEIPLSEQYGDTSHCFIYWKGRYYDAEEPWGVKNPLDLPLFRRKLLDY